MPFSPADLSPIAWYDVQLGGGVSTITDQMGGTAADLGSVSGADSNDPTYVPSSPSIAGAYYPGTSGLFSRITTPDTATLDVTGDFEVWAYIRPSLISYPADRCVISKWGGGGTNSWFLSLQTTGVLALVMSDDGSNFDLFPNSTAAIDSSFTTTPGWVGASYQRNSGAGSYAIKYWTSQSVDKDTIPTQANCTQLGTTKTATSIGATFAGTAPVVIGVREDGANPYEGYIFRALFKDNLNGAVVCDFDASQFATEAATTCLDKVGTNAGTWTMVFPNPGKRIEIVKPPGRARLILGSDDYIRLPTSGALPTMGTTDDWSIVVAARQRSTQSSNGVLISKKTSTTASTLGPSLRTNGTSLQNQVDLGDGTTGATATGPSLTDHRRYVHSAVVSGGGATLTLYANNAAGSGVSLAALTGTRTNTSTSPNIGRGGGGANFQDFALFAVLTLSRALTAAEIANLTSYYSDEAQRYSRYIFQPAVQRAAAW